MKVGNSQYQTNKEKIVPTEVESTTVKTQPRKSYVNLVNNISCK